MKKATKARKPAKAPAKRKRIKPITPRMYEILAHLMAGRNPYHDCLNPQESGATGVSLYAMQDRGLIDNSAKGWKLTDKGKAAHRAKVKGKK